jgi:hypothetical protein
VRVSDQVVYEVVDREAVVLDLVSGRYFQLNEVATRALELIGETGDFGAVEEKIAREYEVDRGVLASDLGQLVDELRARGLLDRAQRPA